MKLLLFDETKNFLMWIVTYGYTDVMTSLPHN